MRTRRKVWIAAAAVLGLKLLLLALWGERAPIFDEAGYLKTARAVSIWLTGGAGDPSVLGRIAWHNPGYGLIASFFATLGDDSGWGLRLLQAVAGVHTGLCVHALLARRISGAGAMLGAAIVWLHPSMLFFGLTLWPVALATWCVAATTLAVDDLARNPRSRARAASVGWTFLPLPFLAPQALLLTPLLAAVVYRIQRRALPSALGPFLAFWLPWSVAVSVALGAITPMDFAGRETFALGNNPHIPLGRGSSFDEPDSLGLLRGQVADVCGDAMDAARVRCDAATYGKIARRSVGEEPAAAAARALLRVIEAYGPDRFLLRHLRDERAFPEPPPSGVLKGLSLGMTALQVLLILGVLVSAANPRGRRDTAALMVAVGLWTIGIALTIGATRLRQPALPWIVVATLTTLYPALPTQDRSRRPHGHVPG